MGIAQLKLFWFIPLHSKGFGLVCYGNNSDSIWWDGFKSYRRWMQVLILLGIVQLKIWPM